MGSVFGGLNYDFPAARQRRDELVRIYRLLKRDGYDTGNVKAQIQEIDIEIEEAHKSGNGKMTVLVDGHSVMQIGNLHVPIVPHWRTGNKEELEHA